MSFYVRLISVFFFFFNDTATTEIYTLSLHDALPISGGCGSQFQLIITNPTGPAGSSLANTARYHGLASGQSAAAASESSTELTNRSCPGATRRARTASRFWSVISSRVTATSARLQATAAGSWRGQACGRDVAGGIPGHAPAEGT